MIPLNQIQIPKPCGENWDAMDGDTQRRFCAGCGCHVHDLSAMTETQAQTLLDNAEGRVCVRFQTRPDGTVLTQDAAPLIENATFWPRRLAAAASWALALALTGMGLTAHAETAPVQDVHAKTKPHAAKPVPIRPGVRLGRIAFPRQPEKTMGIRQGQPVANPKPQTTMGDVAAKPLRPSPPVVMGAPLPAPPSQTLMGGFGRPPKK